MPKITTPLSDTKIKKLMYQKTNNMHTDGKGLSLIVKPDNKKVWEFRYTSPTTLKRRKTSFKNYPEISLKQARNKRKYYINLINDGIDPIDYYKEKKAKIKQEKKGLFENVAIEWIERQEKNLAPSTYKRKKALIANDVISHFKGRTISSIKHPEVVTILENKSNTAPETAKRLFNYLDDLWRYATMKGYCDFNIISNIHKSILKKVPNNSYAKITDPVILKELINAIYSYQGHISTRNLLKFVLHVPLRANNLVTLKWDYINFDKKLLTIPRELMKNKRTNLPDFKMPLSDEVIEILKEQHIYTKNRSYVFVGDKGEHIHPETGNQVLKKSDFNNEAKGRKQRMHSFRGTFRSIAETEHTANDNVKEIALDHFTKDRVKLAYINKANYEKQLRELMEWWSGFIMEMVDE